MSRAGSAGFSLVESLVVAALLATMVGFALPLWNGFIRDRHVARAADDLAGLLRYAQQAAVADSADACAYRVVVLASTAQALKVARDPGTGACASPEQVATVRVVDPFAAGTTATPITLEFRPSGALSGCGGPAPLVTVSSGPRTRVIRVEPCTGAVEVLP